MVIITYYLEMYKYIDGLTRLVVRPNVRLGLERPLYRYLSPYSHYLIRRLS